MNHITLVQNLIVSGYLKTPRIVAAFKKVDRKDFVPEELRDQAYVNAPLPIGWGQTISQPLTVAFMLELLSPRHGEKILDIGSGSGWQTALLAHIVGPKGQVYAIERIPELREFGEQNAAKYNLKNITWLTADASECLPLHRRGFEGRAEFASFDRIIAAAAAHKLPSAWKKQLKIGGRIVAPVGSSIWQYDRIGENEWKEKEYPGFAFVPLIQE